MKIYDSSGKYIKLVPKRFEACQNIHACFTDLDHKRLTRDERVNIEIMLFKQSLDAHTRTQLIGKTPVEARYVHVRDNDQHDYFTVVFAYTDKSGKREVKCPKRIFNLVAKRVEIHRMF